MDPKKRHSTKYPGVFYREANRIGKSGTENVYYVAYKKDGKGIEAIVGREYADGMTPYLASKKRIAFIEGREETPQEKRKRKQREKEQAEIPQTINQLWEKYLEEHDGGDRREVNRYNKYLKRKAGPGKRGGKPSKLYMPKKYMFGKMKPSELTKPLVDAFKRDLEKGKLSDKKLSKQTVKLILELLRRICNWGKKQGYCDRLNFQIEFPKVENERDVWLSDDEIERLKRASDKSEFVMTGLMIRFILLTGLRSIQCYRLKWSHINRESMTMKTLGKKRNVIWLPLSNSALEILDSIPPHKSRIHSPSPFVFYGKGGKQRTTMQKGRQSIFLEAGLQDLEYPFHSLRHTYGSRLASSGEVDIYLLSKLMGHRSVRVTEERYGHLLPDRMKAGADIAAKLFS